MGTTEILLLFAINAFSLLHLDAGASPAWSSRLWDTFSTSKLWSSAIGSMFSTLFLEIESHLRAERAATPSSSRISLSERSNRHKERHTSKPMHAVIPSPVAFNRSREAMSRSSESFETSLGVNFIDSRKETATCVESANGNPGEPSILMELSTFSTIFWSDFHYAAFAIWCWMQYSKYFQILQYYPCSSRGEEISPLKGGRRKSLFFLSVLTQLASNKEASSPSQQRDEATRVGRGKGGERRQARGEGASFPTPPYSLCGMLSSTIHYMSNNSQFIRLISDP